MVKSKIQNNVKTLENQGDNTLPEKATKINGSTKYEYCPKRSILPSRNKKGKIKPLSKRAQYSITWLFKMFQTPSGKYVITTVDDTAYVQCDPVWTPDEKKALQWAKEANDLSSYQNEFLLRSYARVLSINGAFKKALEFSSEAIKFYEHDKVIDKVRQLKREREFYLKNMPYTKIPADS